MANYSYLVKSTTGATQKGKVQAGNYAEAVDVIKKPGFFILELKESAPRFTIPFFNQKEKLSSFERINFTDHLAALIKAGTPLREALEAYTEDGDHRSTMIGSISKSIEQGKKLSQALSAFPHIFSPLYISLVKAGETVGNLDETLEYLANELRREHEFVQRVKSALFYPALVLSVAFIVITMITLFVVPKITEITNSLTSDIPFTTRVIISTSKFLNQYGLLVILLIAFLIFIGFSLSKTEQTKQKISRWLLKVPLIGKIIKKYILARFLRIVGSSIKYGITYNNAFESAEEVVNNYVYQKACQNMAAMVQKGLSLSQAISAQGKELFPGLITRTVKGAEKTGGLDKALHRLSTQYETEVDRDLKRLTELLEPMLIIILGIIVLGIAISVIAPIYQLTSKIK